MKNKTIKNYLEILSSKESMPGGGSVAALNGACGYALILMVCNLSLGKEKYKKYERLIKASIKEATKKRNLFLKWMNDDIRYFKNMEKVFKMKKDTDLQKEKRKIAMEKACKICCIVPSEIIKLSDEGLKMVKKLIGKTNISAASDLIVAKESFEASKKQAYENILINLKYISDKNFVKKYKNVKGIYK